MLGGLCGRGVDSAPPPHVLQTLVHQRLEDPWTTPPPGHALEHAFGHASTRGSKLSVQGCSTALARQLLTTCQHYRNQLSSGRLCGQAVDKGSKEPIANARSNQCWTAGWNLFAQVCWAKEAQQNFELARSAPQSWCRVLESCCTVGFGHLAFGGLCRLRWL